jgi:uncharacterized protein YgiM (DUF1202 family)
MREATIVNLSLFRATLASALIFAASSALANPVTISRDCPLYAEARAGSGVVTELNQGTPGEVIGKRGAWLNVKTGGGTGWLLSTNVRYGAAAATSASPSSESGGWNPFARRSSAQSTSTIGIRGFDKETIGTALGGGSPVSTAQLALLEGYKAEKADGESFASSKSLTASKVDY